MTKHTLSSSVLAAAALTVAHVDAGQFDDFSRKSRAEVYGFGEYLTGWDTSTFFNRSVSLDFEPAFGGGLGVGFGVGDHLNINTDFSVARLDFTGQVPGATVTGDSTLLRWNVNLDYNILKRRFTPLLTGGVGIMHFSGDLGPGTEFSETDFSWGVGGGVRWDITDHWFAKAVYRVNWTSLKDSDDPTMFHSVALGIGYAF